jgi:hypothetical protein
MEGVGAVEIIDLIVIHPGPYLIGRVGAVCAVVCEDARARISATDDTRCQRHCALLIALPSLSGWEARILCRMLPS